MYEFAVTPAVTQLRRPGVIITEVEQGSLGEELELEPLPRPDFGVAGAWYRAGNVQVHLIARPEGAAETPAPAAPTSPIANHTAFAIEDYAKTVELLRARGAEVLEMRPGQGPQLWIQDPDGNVIELTAVRE